MKVLPEEPVEVPPIVVTVTNTAPAAWLGEVTVSEVADPTVTAEAGTAPKSTTVPVVNPVPVTVTDVPPAVAPVFGVIAEMVGTGGATSVKPADGIGVTSAEVQITTLKPEPGGALVTPDAASDTACEATIADPTVMVAVVPVTVTLEATTPLTA